MIHKAGGRITYAPDAIVKEEVVPERAHFGWLSKRYFRFGQTHGLLLLEDQGAALTIRMKNALIALSKVLFCFIAAVLNVTNAVRVMYWLLRGTMHLGVVSRLLGISKLEQYG